MNGKVIEMDSLAKHRRHAIVQSMLHVNTPEEKVGIAPAHYSETVDSASSVTVTVKCIGLVEGKFLQFEKTEKWSAQGMQTTTQELQSGTIASWREWALYVLQSVQQYEGAASQRFFASSSEPGNEEGNQNNEGH